MNDARESAGVKSMEPQQQERAAKVIALPRLPLADMSARHIGLTKAVADSYLEAARVCLDRHHISPVTFSIQEPHAAQEADLEWQAADGRTRAAWANEIDATEAGAYACALAAVELAQGLVALSRAENLTGADYYIGRPGQSHDDLEGCLRLEVSGTDKGDSRTLELRLNRKAEQAAAGLSNLPAMAGVVGFRVRLILLRRLEHA